MIQMSDFDWFLTGLLVGAAGLSAIQHLVWSWF